MKNEKISKEKIPSREYTGSVCARALSLNFAGRWYAFCFFYTTLFLIPRWREGRRARMTNRVLWTKKKEEEEEKRRLSGEREQSVFSESGWRAYTYIEVVLRVADIHTWRATWSYSFCFVLFSLARAARQRRRRKERTCKKKVRSSQSNSAFTVDAASLKRARRSCSVKSLVILALGAMAKAEYTKIRGKSICDTDGTGGPSGGI